MRILLSRVAVLITLLAVALTCPGKARTQAKPIRVAAAADLQPVLPPILRQFREKTGSEVEVTYASSATLATQILNGAPYDLFLSADLDFARRLNDAGLSDAPVPYARGTLVLWARKDSALLANHTPLTLASLRSDKLKRLAVANPDHAPYGRAASSLLQHLQLAATLQPKLVVGENIAQAAQFAQSGNADAGLISLTSALTPAFQEAGVYIVPPQELYPPLTQGAAVLKHSPGAAGGQRLLEFLLSHEVQSNLAAHGLQPVN